MRVLGVVIVLAVLPVVGGVMAAEPLPNSCIRFPRASPACQEALALQRERRQPGHYEAPLPSTNTAAIREQREMEELRQQRRR